MAFMTGKFDQIYRMNPLFTITPAGELSPGQRERFRRFLSRENVYGLLHAPPDSNLTVKVIDRGLAVFLEKFRQPARIPEVHPGFFDQGGAQKRQFILRLVLDEVLEVSHRGRFIAGVDAVNRVLYPGRIGSEAGPGEGMNCIQSLSRGAILTAVKSSCDDPRDLSFILYAFNRIPMSRYWRMRFPDEAAVAEFLGLKEDGSWEGMPARVRVRPVKRDEQGEPMPFDVIWRSWNTGEQGEEWKKPKYKVYVSPAAKDLPEVFRMVREGMLKWNVSSMKTGREIQELLRPDKLMLYFSDYRSALDCAAEIADMLSPFGYHGVPFTCPVWEDNPGVSVGVDPPDGLTGSGSWRSYIADKIALAIKSIRRRGEDDYLDHINTHLRALGIDGSNWRPVNRDWSMEFDMDK